SQSREDDGIGPVVGAINQAFARQWMEQQVTPAPRAPDLALARRLSLALTGSIPSLEGIRQLTAEKGDARLQTWLDGLLQDRRFADYFAERLARTYVGSEGGPFLVYRRRRFLSWLSDQLLHNRPHDEIVRELIASQGLWTDQPATNFVTVTIQPDNKKGPDA